VKGGVPATHTAVLNGVLYFAYDDGYYGEELWKYDPLQCATPTASLALEGSTVCSNGSATVRVKAAQAGVYYQLYYSNVPVGQSRKSSGGDLLLPVPATHLSVGTQAFTVKAFGCTEVTLTQQATITVLPALNPPAVPGKTIASGQAATLTASGAPAGAAYRWYSAASGGNLLFTGASYTTPALTVTTHYYVAAALAGCAESARTKVTVTVSPAGGTTAFRVNAGGNAFATIDARSFAADAYFAGGVVSTATTQGIAGTADDYLYQTGRTARRSPTTSPPATAVMTWCCTLPKRITAIRFRRHRLPQVSREPGRGAQADGLRHCCPGRRRPAGWRKRHSG
jgi:hypothetical protein